MGFATVDNVAFIDDTAVTPLRRDLWVGAWPPTGDPGDQLTSAADGDGVTPADGTHIVTFATALIPGAEYAASVDDVGHTYVLFRASEQILESDSQYASEGDVLTIVNGRPTWTTSSAGRHPDA